MNFPFAFQCFCSSIFYVNISPEVCCCFRWRARWRIFVLLNTLIAWNVLLLLLLPPQAKCTSYKNCILFDGVQHNVLLLAKLQWYQKSSKNTLTHSSKGRKNECIFMLIFPPVNFTAKWKYNHAYMYVYEAFTFVKDILQLTFSIECETENLQRKEVI